MKRLLLVCAVLTLSVSAFAQKANVRKAKSTIEFAQANYTLSNLDEKKLETVRELMADALTNPESAVMADAWKIAAQLKLYDMNAMIQQRIANNNQFVDAKAFFQNQYDIITYLEKYDQLLNTPNEKGKLPKEELRHKERANAQLMAKGPRDNLFIAATNMVNTDPAATVKYLDLYYETFTDSLFNGMDLKAGDSHLTDSYYIYAVALKNSNGDKGKIEESLAKALDSQNYGKNACFELMTMKKDAGDMEGWRTYCALAMEKYPTEGIFARLLMQEYVNEKLWDKVVALAEKTIAHNKEANVTDEWPYYFKAVSFFSKEQYEPAYAAFVETVEVKPDFVDALAGAGKTAWKIAQDNAKNAAKSKEWYNKAIMQFEKAREVAPDQPDQWGYSLYACYNNTGNMAKAAQFKKYAK